ncbi:MAG: putative secreted protein [Rhodobacteraceae bacterium HLUCCA12]|nr:MAG: putative secreted protein [Rhodobacteraceae bacterium HLUCCA12]
MAHRAGRFWNRARGILACAVALIGMSTALMPGAARAQLSMPDESYASQVVLELYTSQGCAACPPADAMMADLAMREDVIALALHVDYWDYIGWTDVFARPGHAERQKEYARRNGHNTIYTPQVIINGQDIVEGFRVAQVMEMIADHRARAARVDLDLERVDAGALEIRLSNRTPEEPLMLTSRGREPAAPAQLGALAEQALNGADGDDRRPLRLQLVRYRPSAHVEISAGENAGRQAQYFNIVTSWETIADWDMRTPLELSVEIEGEEPAVVILQEPDHGEIVAAARLR